MVFPPEHILSLSDGRKISYAIFGDETCEKSVFYFHGFPSSRNEAHMFASSARHFGIRLIAADRPGYGSSSPQPGRCILDWSADLAALASHLDVTRYAVLGVSGGAPYALAMRHGSPDPRCVGVGVVCGFPPSTLGTEGMMMANRAIMGIAQWSTWIVAKALNATVGSMVKTNNDEDQAKAEAKFGEQASKTWPKPDAEAWRADPDVRKALMASMAGAFEQGGTAAAWEFYLNGHDWGFKLEELSVKPGKMVFWHGTHDINAPIGKVEEMSRLIKHAELRISMDDAHISVIPRKRDEIMETLGRMFSN
ncbi:alpha/beta-hydrolase [Xylariaceae sp. FL0255]|nr:alpha/beta-hydrolase [Xylariaceae sp. FL0255]